MQQQCIAEYLTQGTGYRKLAARYGASRTTINKWVIIHQGIYNLPLNEKNNLPFDNVNSLNNGLWLQFK